MANKNEVLELKKILFALGLAALTLTGCGQEAKPSQSSVMVKLSNGHGTGVHTSAGFILTAAHVVGTTPTVTVIEKDGTKTLADVRWTSKRQDIALLKPRMEIETAKSALHCRDVVQGEPIYTIGNPQPEFFAYTRGFVATSKPETKGMWHDLITMDMTIVPGNSGGPVYDADGFLVGIVVAVGLYGMGGGITGVSYMVPVNTLCDLLNVRRG